MAMIACSKKGTARIDTWNVAQDGSDGDFLRLEQTADGPQAYFSLSANQWFGPLEIEMNQAGIGTFQIKDVTLTNGNNSVTMQPPEITKNIRYIMDQKGRLLIKSYLGIKMDGVVKISLSGKNLLTDGLWANINNTRWDEKGEANEFTVEPLKITFTKLEKQAEK